MPHVISNSSYKLQSRNGGTTEFVEIPNRGHSLTIDSGWRDVAKSALDLITRFAVPTRSGGAG